MQRFKSAGSAQKFLVSFLIAICALHRRLYGPAHKIPDISQHVPSDHMLRSVDQAGMDLANYALGMREDPQTLN
jgi:hypothetical protein